MALLLLFLVYAIGLSVALWSEGVRSTTKTRTEPSQKPLTRLLIIGATGGTGRHLVAQALGQGYAVTALARDPWKLSLEHERLTLLQGDVLDYSSVEKAVRDQDAVISALGHKRFFGPTRILSEGTGNILRAMAAHGVRRFVCETSLGIGSSAGRMGLYYSVFVIPLILPWYFWDKTQQEQLIATSGLEWVIVRPAVLTDRKMKGACRSGAHVGNYIWTATIARGDVADFMLKQLTSDEHLGKAVGISW